MNEEKNPWKINGEKKIYSNSWIDVTEYDVINPSGNPGIYGVVHYKQLAIGALPLDEEHNIYLVGQYRFPLNQYSWEIPEGGGKPDVAPVESAKRELKEETGIEAEVWTQILQTHTSNSVADEFGVIFLAQKLSFKQASPEETEVFQIKKIHIDEACHLVNNGKITDSLSVMAILKVKLMIIEGKIK
ncbi:MAG TPA: DNA mismatch repair protein MutT [Bacteroidetes bacterium]|nr:DNA mismatch repair protein MutT [Bacteroidota bacterium]